MVFFFVLKVYMEKLTVVKVGGAVVEDKARLSRFLDDFAAMKGLRVLVHGGGRSATQIASRLGIETTMVNGRRVTDRDMLDVVTMVYGGLVNKNVVAALQALGINALGMTGADLNFMLSHVRPPVNGVDYGFVGDVDKADGKMLSNIVAQGITPVIAPLTHDGKGCMLNTNADTIASETAKALAPYFDVTLMYCFEKDGVLANPDDDSSVIEHIDRESFGKYVIEGVISGGMIPKVENALSSISNGVRRVIITNASHLDGCHGTRIEG